jgi:hypothetical protein
LPWHGNLYQGERASEKREGSEGLEIGPPALSSAFLGGEVDKEGPPGGLTTPDFEKKSNRRVQSLPLPPLQEELALARRILGLSRNPSRARDLALVLVRRLERLTEKAARGEVG